MSTTTLQQQNQKQSLQSKQESQGQSQQTDSIEVAANFIRKRLEEVRPAQLIVRTNGIGSQKELEGVCQNEGNMNRFADRLSGLDIKMVRVKDPADPKQEALEFIWTEGNDEVPEEEEADDSTQRTQSTEPTSSQTSQITGGNGGRGSVTSSGRAITNRGLPLPEPVRNIDMSQIQSISDVLKNVTVQHIVYDNWTRKSLVLVNSNQPADRALSRINTHNIHSIPVVDANSNNGVIIGVLDILDIISALSESWDNNSTRAQRRDKLTVPISELLSKESHPQAHIMSIHTSLFDAVKEFAQSKLRRVLIVERQLEHTIIKQDKPENMVIGLLTESDLIRFMAENLMWIKREKIFQQTLRDLNIGQRKPIIVQPDILAYQAFQEIHKNEGRDGVALVDTSGKLIANISASNIKGMTRANIQLLFRPLTDFLARDRKRGWWQLPICTTLDTTLENVVLQFVATKVHRMYIVDDEGKPTGEVSLSDVIQQLGSL